VTSQNKFALINYKLFTIDKSSTEILLLFLLFKMHNYIISPTVIAVEVYRFLLTSFFF